MIAKYFAIFLLFEIKTSGCLRILFVEPGFSQAQVIPLQNLAVELSNAGHEVTFVSLYPLNKSVPNYRDIKIKIDDDYQEAIDFVNKAIMVDTNVIKLFPVLNKIVYDLGNETLQSSAVKNLMNKEKFDLVITGYFVNDFLVGLADHFKCPSIIFSNGGHVALLKSKIGNPKSADGASHGLLGANNFEFFSRVRNFMLYSFESIALGTYFYYHSKKVYE